MHTPRITILALTAFTTTSDARPGAASAFRRHRLASSASGNLMGFDDLTQRMGKRHGVSPALRTLGARSTNALV